MQLTSNARWQLKTALFRLSWHYAIDITSPDRSQIDFLTGKTHYDLYLDHIANFERILIDDLHVNEDAASEMTGIIQEHAEYWTQANFVFETVSRDEFDNWSAQNPAPVSKRIHYDMNLLSDVAINSW